MNIAVITAAIQKVAAFLSCRPAHQWTQEEINASPAFDAGWRAGEEGSSMKNPHRQGSLEWHAWRAGREYSELLSRQW
ncbi:hypothetical protein [Burkholderia latens]|uniref:hypothetical protein n=1 Tax=Burkholderia latens TaxID=488446 RepID=UPI001AE22968|nr:hypothetical protein [Burkholderia latens]QTO42197.1 hypothetical protein J8I85_08830 [Burkholderia latens]